VAVLRSRGLPDEPIERLSSEFGAAVLRQYPALFEEAGSFNSSTLASRITRTLDLAGGAVAIDSGATSALSGLALCVDLLLAGDNELMICAAGQRHLGPRAFAALRQAGLLAS